MIERRWCACARKTSVTAAKPSTGPSASRRAARGRGNSSTGATCIAPSGWSSSLVSARAAVAAAKGARSPSVLNCLGALARDISVFLGRGDLPVLMRVIDRAWIISRKIARGGFILEDDNLGAEAVDMGPLVRCAGCCGTPFWQSGQQLCH